VSLLLNIKLLLYSDVSCVFININVVQLIIVCMPLDIVDGVLVVIPRTVLHCAV